MILVSVPVQLSGTDWHVLHSEHSFIDSSQTLSWTSSTSVYRLSLVPVAYLAPAFAALRFIWSSVEQAQASKQQLRVLAQSIAQLLHTINGEYRAQRLLESGTSTPLADLRG